jgi:arylsulfatase A-like enzyme
VVSIPDADALGAFGRADAGTPHIDALAAEGTVFTNAFIQHPVCSPSRASFMTGWYPHVGGHRTLDGLLRPDEPNFLKTFKEQGYRVVVAGDRGDMWAPGATEASAHEYGFLQKPVGKMWGGEERLLRAEAPSVETSSGENIEPDDPLWGRLYYRGRVADDEHGLDFDEAAVRTAEAWLRTDHDGPWVLFVPLVMPHCPFQAPDPWYSMHDRSRQPPPVPAPADPDAAPGYLRELRDRHGLERATPEVWAEVAAVYQGMVSRLDWHVGRLRAAVADADAAQNTAVAFFADHGEYLGDFGVIEKWPSAMHPCITRDPLIIAGAGLPTGQTSDTMVELVDVFPTLLDLAGLEAGHPHFGRSLRHVLEDPAREHREYAFTEGGFRIEEEDRIERSNFPYDLKSGLAHERPELVGRAFAVRDRDWAYVFRLYEPPELYDRRADPHETANLAGAPEHASVEDRLRTALLRWLAETADVLVPNVDPRRPPVTLPLPGESAGPGPGRDDDDDSAPSIRKREAMP